MYLKPQLNFKVKSLEDNVNIIADFFEDDRTINNSFQKYIANALNINVNELLGKTLEQKKEIIKNIVSPIYDVKLNQMNLKKDEFSKFWNENSMIVCQEFQNIFKIGFSGIKQYDVEIGINPVCPRYLDDFAFDVYYVKSKEDALETCIHELIHFYWFQIFNENFPEIPKSKFEAPFAEWLLSEIAVDPIIYYSKLRNYCREKPAYNYLYNEKINGENLIEFFRRLYKSNNLKNFMEKGLNVLNSNPELLKQLIK